MSDAPRLARKRASECTHEHCEVAMNEAELSCSSCGAALDPWWFLRRMVDNEERDLAEKQQLHEQHQAWCVAARDTQIRLREEIAQLTEVKNRLWNEQVNGAPLGTQIRRRSRP